MKSSKVISTTALVLSGLMVTTGNQTIARADNGEQAGVTATKQAATSQAPATQESMQAKQLLVMQLVKQ